ncbi:transposase (plasmid) [Aromatoleum aromaticum EbN1]|uniref:Transposase n=1 Tax=Aromatoleum aromaticum (strain DSM 19018 / LMG 30748 / EbN1) TaxID=76114 RepID=Q5NWF3_AROAE|nr:IS1182-like element ISAzo2 family transposase [Aromatoleum aromaticum]CAI10611.1 transposase [Aromatoleum aromaticum EbN1]CAI10626.1 transposase [Aromatoleum aromaticum EbN1]
MAFHPIDRDTDFLLPPSVQDWLPEAHLARYVVDVVEQLDLSAMERAYAGRGSDAYHPATLLALLIYGYATGTFSSRKIERATYDSLAFRYIACNRHPDHDTLANFRKRFGGEFEAAFVQVLQVARENQLSRFGTVSLDGTKIHANASRHSALSYGHARTIEAQLKVEVQELMKLAAAADQSSLPDGVKLPDEIRRREDRLAAIAAAKAKIEARAAERFEREQAEHQAKLAKRQAQEAKTGKKPGGKPPKPPQAGPRADDQINLTDEESRIMPVSGGGFEQSYNAQAVVDTESMLILATHVTQATNDKEQVAPMLAKVQSNPEGLNRPATWLADTGYYSEKNVTACVAAKIEPLIAVKRDEHHPDWRERFSEPEPLAAGASAVETMKHKLKTRAGRAAYALRKQTVEPVFGIIKSVMGFRQFLLRGLDNVTNEWTLVCLAWNLKRMAVLRPQ